jgi:hypothetical protein
MRTRRQLFAPYANSIQRVWRSHICRRAYHARQFMKVPVWKNYKIYKHNAHVKNIATEYHLLIRNFLSKPLIIDPMLIYLLLYFTRRCHFQDHMTHLMVMLARDAMMHFHSVLVLFRHKKSPDLELRKDLAHCTLRFIREYHSWFAFQTEFGNVVLDTLDALYRTKKHLENSIQNFEQGSPNAVRFTDGAAEVDMVINEVYEFLHFDSLRLHADKIEKTVDWSYTDSDPYSDGLYDVEEVVLKVRALVRRVYRFMQGNHTP